jgi:hypothetical protein
MENNLKIGDSVRCFFDKEISDDFSDGFVEIIYNLKKNNVIILNENGWAHIEKECKNIRILLLEKDKKK